MSLSTVFIAMLDFIFLSTGSNLIAMPPFKLPLVIQVVVIGSSKTMYSPLSI